MTLSDPCSLSSAELVRQAVSVLQKTSRARRPEWEREARAQRRKLHLFSDGVESAAAVEEDGEWEKLPLSPRFFNGEETEPALRRALSAFGRPAKALGVILHAAEAFTVTDLAEAAARETPEAELRARLTAGGRSAAELAPDASFPDDACFPVPGVLRAAAHPRSAHAALLRGLRETGVRMDVPVLTRAGSAPLEAVRALPALWPEFDPERPLLLLVRYPRFSVLAAFAAGGTLERIVSAPHRGLGYPDRAGELAVSVLESAGLAPPRILLADLCAERASWEAMLPGLVRALRGHDETLAERVTAVSLEDLRRGSADVERAGRPEFLSARELGAPRGTFFLAAEEGLAAGDLLPPEPEERVFPDRGDLRLLRAARLTVPALWLGVAAALGFGTREALRAARSPSWRLPPGTVARTGAEAAEAAVRRARLARLESAATPRGGATAVIELLCAMFPEESGLRLTRCEITQSAEASGRPHPAAAWRRAILLTGEAAAGAEAALDRLEAETETARLFSETGRALGDSSWTAGGARALTVRGSRGRAEAEAEGGGAARPVRFTLEIIQRFPEGDPCGLPAAAPEPEPVP